MTRKRLALITTATALIVILTISTFFYISSKMVEAQLPTVPANLKELVELPNWTVQLRDLNATDTQKQLNTMMTSIEGFNDVKQQLAGKGYQFTNTSARISEATLQYDNINFLGFALSWWSSNVGPNGTRAFIVAASIGGWNPPIVLGIQTNLLPPDQVPGIDPFIIVNAMPYMYVQLWWWVPSIPSPALSKLVYWEYWWYDSHSHPNWFWGIYWWWRSYTRYYGLLLLPWHWWFWNWVYWRHWYWWSTYFAYV